MVSGQMIGRVTATLGRTPYEVPTGFKWFVRGLLDGSLGFGGEVRAGASFARLDGAVWTTDKDGMVPESFRGADHVRRILEEAQTMVTRTLAVSSEKDGDRRIILAMRTPFQRPGLRECGKASSRSPSWARKIVLSKTRPIGLPFKDKMVIVISR